MKILLITICLFSGGCWHLISSNEGGPDPKIRERIIKLVQGQREKKDWMKTDTCPAAAMPEELRRPKADTTSCRANPEECLAACNLNEADSCYALAGLIQEHDTIENDVADVLYRRACQLGITSGCTNAAANLFERAESDSLACAARTFESTCEREDPWGCTMHGLALAQGVGRERDVAKAIQALDRACALSVEKNGPACTKAKELKAAVEEQDHLEKKDL